MVLYVDAGSGSQDSAQARFYADNTGAAEFTGSGLPTATQLLPNYPNPFNPSTTIEYVLGLRSPVSIKIYDVLGREVATLVDEVKQPGVYTVRWDASKQSSGVYIYRLQAGEFVQTKKMIVLR
jgi:hypothetical protein